jgi:hypothetical protein
MISSKSSVPYLLQAIHANFGPSKSSETGRGILLRLVEFIFLLFLPLSTIRTVKVRIRTASGSI